MATENGQAIRSRDPLDALRHFEKEGRVGFLFIGAGSERKDVT